MGITGKKSNIFLRQDITVTDMAGRLNQETPLCLEMWQERTNGNILITYELFVLTTISQLLHALKVLNIFSR